MAVIDDVRPLGAELERSNEVYVRGRLKFCVGQIVYVAFSLDERVLGFGPVGVDLIGQRRRVP